MSARPTQRMLMPLLERLLDETPAAEQRSQRDQGFGHDAEIDLVRDAVCRDIEAMLNARRPWHRAPPELDQLPQSPYGYGLPDFTAGALADPDRREALRREIEATLRRMEPRLAQIQVSQLDEGDQRRATLRFRIEAVLRVEAAAEPVTFDTTVDTASAVVAVRTGTARG